ncbi:MAG: hypothetical protein AB7N24_12135 [Dehalococcoidia bacterium]
MYETEPTTDSFDETLGLVAQQSPDARFTVEPAELFSLLVAATDELRFWLAETGQATIAEDLHGTVLDKVLRLKHF